MNSKIRQSLFPKYTTDSEIKAVMKQFASVKNPPGMTLVTGDHFFHVDPVINSNSSSEENSPIREYGGAVEEKKSLSEKIFGNKVEAVSVATEASPPKTGYPNKFRKLHLIARATASIKSTHSILESEDAMEEDEEDDNCEIMPLESPQGHSLRFVYSPKEYIEYSIAVKAATDLCSTFDYFNAHSDTYNLQVGFNTQQVCCLNGTAVTNIGNDIVTVSLSFNPENSRFAITIHSYDKDAAREVGRLFRKLCRKGNFYKGKHLQANSFERDPLAFMTEPLKQKIYGFEKEYASIRTNTLSFFGMHTLHKLCNQRGVLLSGLPGSGKSLIVSQIKRECLESGITVVDMSMAAMHNVGEWYDKIEKWLSPCLIVMEDLDIIGVSRDMEKSVQPITTDLLNSLSGNQKGRAVLVTLATTNRPEVLDSALIRARRMDQRYTISGLNPDFKKQLLKSYLSPHHVELTPDISDKAVSSLGEETTGADISSIAVSTLIHVNQGKSPDEAFIISLEEWKDAHQKRGCKTGFVQPN